MQNTPRVKDPEQPTRLGRHTFAELAEMDPRARRRYYREYENKRLIGVGVLIPVVGGGALWLHSHLAHQYIERPRDQHQLMRQVDSTYSVLSSYTMAAIDRPAPNVRFSVSGAGLQAWKPAPSVSPVSHVTADAEGLELYQLLSHSQSAMPETFQAEGVYNAQLGGISAKVTELLVDSAPALPAGTPLALDADNAVQETTFRMCQPFRKPGDNAVYAYFWNAPVRPWSTKDVLEPIAQIHQTLRHTPFEWNFNKGSVPVQTPLPRLMENKYVRHAIVAAPPVLMVVTLTPAILFARAVPRRRTEKMEAAIQQRLAIRAQTAR